MSGPPDKADSREQPGRAEVDREHPEPGQVGRHPGGRAADAAPATPSRHSSTVRAEVSRVTSWCDQPASHQRW